MTTPTGTRPPDWSEPPWAVRSPSWARPVPAADEGRYRPGWRQELTVAAVVAAFCTLFGSVVGLVWPRVAPHIALVPAINGSEAATKSLLGDDLWLALLGIVAGLLSVAVVVATGGEAATGPGGVIGLGVGGALGSLVAAHVGHQVQHPHVVASLHAAYPTISARSVRTVLRYFDFRVRAKAVLVAWPVVAVAVHAAIVLARRSPRVVRPSGRYSDRRV